jgi:hypothetical protein
MDEAGLPVAMPDMGGEAMHNELGVGVVRRVYPGVQWRVDIEPERGGFLSKALVIGPHQPPVHQDRGRPSYVVFTHLHSHLTDVICWPLTVASFSGPRADQGKKGEIDFYHPHLFLEKNGPITIRVTTDGRYIVESDAGDYVELKPDTREVRVIAPHIFLGSLNKTRIEYVQGADVTVDSPQVHLGSRKAKQRVILGDLFMTFLNLVIGRLNNLVLLFNTHVHFGVFPGPSITAVPALPATPALPMLPILLSDAVYVEKGGSAFGAVLGTVTGAIGAVAGGGVLNVGDFVSNLGPLADTFSSITDVAGGLTSFLDTLPTSITGGLTDVLNSIAPDLLSSVTDVLQNIDGLVNGELSSLVGTLTGGVTDTLLSGSLGNILQETLNFLPGDLGAQLANTLGSLAPDQLATFGSLLARVQDQLGSSTDFDSILTSLGSNVDALGALPAGLQSVKNAFASADATTLATLVQGSSVVQGLPGASLLLNTVMPKFASLLPS